MPLPEAVLLPLKASPSLLSFIFVKNKFKLIDVNGIKERNPYRPKR